MPATATLKFSAAEGYAPEGTRSIQGDSRRVPYLVDDSEIESALMADGLPQIGAEHPTDPSLVVRSLTWQYYGYKSSIVWANYEPQNNDSLSFTAQENDTYSEFVINSREVTVTTAANGSAIPQATIELPSAELLIHSFVTSFAAIRVWMGVVSPIPKINNNRFTIPLAWGLPGRFSIDERQCLARPPEITRIRTGLCRITYRMGYGEPGWMDARYRVVNGDGVAQGEVVVKALYDEAAFPAQLWGGITAGNNQTSNPFAPPVSP